MVATLQQAAVRSSAKRWTIEDNVRVYGLKAVVTQYTLAARLADENAADFQSRGWDGAARGQRAAAAHTRRELAQVLQAAQGALL